MRFAYDPGKSDSSVPTGSQNHRDFANLIVCMSL